MDLTLLHDILDRAATRDPTGAALTFRDTTMRYAELTAASYRVADWLRRRGIGRGDRVVVIAPNQPSTVELLYGCSRIGAVFALLHEQVRGEGLRHVLAVIPVRNGALSAGGAEAAAECGGRALLIGSGAGDAAVPRDADAAAVCTNGGEIMAAANLGLEDVVVGPSSICDVNGRTGQLIYRGYDIHDLVQHTTFEEVVFLLWNEDLPNRQQLQQLDRDLKANRALPQGVTDLIKSVPQGSPPMDVLRTAVSLLGLYDPEGRDNSIDATRRKAVRLQAQIPTIATATSDCISADANDSTMPRRAVSWLATR